MKNQSPPEPNVVQYETKAKEYRYQTFWETRAYEDRAERILLKKLIKQFPQEARYLLDIGGSFGRLIDVYAKRFSEIAIADYATNELYLAQESAKKSKVRLHLLSANAYHLPFIDSSQQALICIRVIHHLEDPGIFFQEVERVLAPGGVAIIEAANKNHFKRWWSCLLRGNFASWRSDWADIGSSGVQANNTFTLIRNYSPAYIEQKLASTQLKIVQKRSISWLRRTPLARLPAWFTDNVERFMQPLSSQLMMGPSNWYVLQKPGSSTMARNFEETLADPNTLQPLSKAEIEKRQQIKNKAQYLELRYPVPKH